MGDYQQFQPLTREDRISVRIYRTGIFLSAILIAVSAFLAVGTVFSGGMSESPVIYSGLAANIIILSLYFSIGLTVFFIHLYVGKIHRVIKKLYYLSVACLILMFLLGKGYPSSILFLKSTSGALLLIPLLCCLGFVTAKEAFCFRFYEGYILGIMMPAYLFLYGTGVFDPKSAAVCLAFIAATLLIFTFRKVFMPLHCDIGDKSAYQP